MIERLRRYHHPGGTSLLAFFAVSGVVLGLGWPAALVFPVGGASMVAIGMYRSERRWRDDRAEP